MSSAKEGVMRRRQVLLGNSNTLCMKTTIHYVRHCVSWGEPHFDDEFCFADERLGKMFKAAPPTEDVYVFQNNGPSFDSA